MLLVRLSASLQKNFRYFHDKIDHRYRMQDIGSARLPRLHLYLFLYLFQFSSSSSGVLIHLFLAAEEARGNLERQ